MPASRRAKKTFDLDAFTEDIGRWCAGEVTTIDDGAGTFPQPGPDVERPPPAGDEAKSTASELARLAEVNNTLADGPSGQFAGLPDKMAEGN